MWAAGVKSIIIFQRGDSWGDGIVNLLTPIWTAKGGNVAGDKIRYSTNATDFSNYLAIADQEVKDAVASYGGETQRVGVVILASNEISTILEKVSNYPSLYGVHWWGSTPEIQGGLSDAMEVAGHIGLYSLSPRETITPLYAQLETRYANLTKQKFSVYNAYSYDISLVLSNSMYQTQSSSGIVLVPLQKPIADQTFGSAGSCRLDESGDRIGPSYDVWGYRSDAANVMGRVVVAQFSSDAEAISANHGTEFYPLILGYTPIGP
jgi:ABC-type branched-subunit amino acid transport system substrate-binding protein